MTRQQGAVQPRIEVVDALRGFALLGLCLIHAIEHWDLLAYPDSTSDWLQVDLISVVPTRYKGLDNGKLSKRLDK